MLTLMLKAPSFEAHRAALMVRLRSVFTVYMTNTKFSLNKTGYYAATDSFKKS